MQKKLFLLTLNFGVELLPSQHKQATTQKCAQMFTVIFLQQLYYSSISIFDI